MISTSGVLERTYWHQPPGAHTIADTWGQLLLDNGHVLGFTCKPGLGDPSCAYTPPYNQDPNLGKRLELRYLNAPNRQGPQHVVMEMRGTGQYRDDAILTYAESKGRIEAYRAEAKFPSATAILFWVCAIAILPGLVFRLITGREERTPKAAKRAVQITGL